MKFAFHVRNIAVKDHAALTEVQKTLVKRIISQQTAK